MAASSQPIYQHLRNNLQCATCHYFGTTTAPESYYFADPNFGNALKGFANIASAGPDRIFNNMVNPAHFGGAGPANQSVRASLEPAFTAAAAQYAACKAGSGNGGGNGGGGAGNENPTVITAAKSIPANVTTATNILWNLQTEIQTGTAISGGQFQLTVQADGTNGRYFISAPRARGATNNAIKIRNIRVYLNGVLVPLNTGGSTWSSVNNLAPAARLHPLPSGTGVMVLSADTAVATNTIAVGFGELSLSTQYPNFNPTTYARLTSTQNAVPVGERIFQQKCVGCHGTAGGISVAANNLAALKASGHVVPFFPDASIIFQRVSLAAGDPQRMPQAPNAALVAEEARWIRDWILDGAPP